jgi:hypothetical protein
LTSALYANDTLARLEELKIEHIPKEENPNLKRKVSNYRPKDVKCLMAKIRKRLKSIETTKVRKVMKEEPAKDRKAHTLGVTIFYK